MFQSGAGPINQQGQRVWRGWHLSEVLIEEQISNQWLQLIIASEISLWKEQSSPLRVSDNTGLKIEHANGELGFRCTCMKMNAAIMGFHDHRKAGALQVFLNKSLVVISHHGDPILQESRPILENVQSKCTQTVKLSPDWEVWPLREAEGFKDTSPLRLNRE